jgi:hypothetical protein
VRAGVGEITEGAPTLDTGKRHDDTPSSRNLPIKSWEETRIRNALSSDLADSITLQMHNSKDPEDGNQMY